MTMKMSPDRQTTQAITKIVTRYKRLITEAATGGSRVWIMTPGTERPDLLIRGDAHGAADLAVCAENGDRHIVFTHWPDGDRFFPEKWPAPLPVPNYDRDPMP
jgi:hypothetical protein